MESEVEELQRRVEELEQENASYAEQVQRLTLYVDHDSQGLERRLLAANEQLKEVGDEKHKLSLLKDQLEKDLANVTSDLVKLKATCEEKDTLLLQKQKEVDEERKLRSAMDRAAERREADLKELQLRERNLQDKVVAYLKEKHDAETAAQKAIDEARAAASAQTQLEADLRSKAHLVDVLETENQTLTAQYKEARAELNSKNIKLSGQLEDQTRAADQLRRDLAKERDAAANLQEKLKERNERIRELEDDAAERERDNKMQATLKDNLIKTLQDQNETLIKNAGSLRGAVTALKEQLQSAQAATDEAIQSLREENDLLKRQLNENDEQRQRILEAAAAGQLPLGPGTPIRDIAEGEPDPNVSGWSKLELYNKYMDASANLREEQSKARQYEIIMQQVQSEVEKKAVQVREQYQEHLQLVEAHATISQSLELTRAERHDLQKKVASLKAEADRSAKRTRHLEQDLADRNRQVATLLREVTVLKQGSAAGGTAPSAENRGAVVTAPDVVTGRLVVFRDIEELQTLNANQLIVIRNLTEQLESTKEQIMQECKAQSELEMAQVERELADMATMRTEQQELIEKITRQRDVFRTLLEEAGGDLALAAKSPAAAAAGIVRRSLGEAPTAVEGPDWQKLYQELEKEKDAALKDAVSTLSTVRDELKAQTQSLYEVKAEAGVAKASAEFYQKEMDRYVAMLNAAENDRLRFNQEASSARTAAALLEEQLGTERSNVMSLHEKVREVEAQKRDIQADLKVAEAMLEDHKAKAEAATTRMLEMEASMKTDIDRMRLSEERYKERLAGLEARLQQTQDELEAAHVAHADLVKKADDLSKEREAADHTAFVRLPELENEVKQLKESLEAANYKLGLADGKVESLQNALKSAEARAATLELQSKSRVMASGDEVIELTSAEKDAEIKLLQEDVKKYQVELASRAGAVSTWKTMAETADQALNAAQNEHKKFKAEVERQKALHMEEVKNLEAQVAGVQQELDSRDEELKKVKDELDDLMGKHRHLDFTYKAVQNASLAKELNWEREVQKARDHARATERRFSEEKATSGQLIKNQARMLEEKQSLEARIKRLEDQLRAKEAELDASKNQQVEEETNLKTDNVRLLREVDTAKSRLAELEKENELLLKQLNDKVDAAKANTTDPLSENAEMSELVQHLIREKEVLKGQLAIAKSDSATLEKKLKSAERQLVLAKEQIDGARSDERERVLQEEKFEANRKLLVDNSNLREANNNLRKKLNDTENNLAAERRKVQTNVQHLSQQNRIVGRLEGELQVAKQRADEAAKEADKWSEKVKEMMVKKVDLAEHEKTLEALKEAKQQLIDADKAAKERLAEVETSASKKTSEKVAEVEGTSKQRIADLESKLEQASQDLTKAKDDHAELLKKSMNAIKIVKHISQSENQRGVNAIIALWDERKKRVEEQDKAIKVLQDSVAKLEAEVKEKDARCKDLQAEIGKLTVKVDQAASSEKDKTQQLSKLNLECANLKTQRNDLEQQIKALKAEKLTPADQADSGLPSQGPVPANDAPRESARRVQPTPIQYSTAPVNPPVVPPAEALPVAVSVPPPEAVPSLPAALAKSDPLASTDPTAIRMTLLARSIPLPVPEAAASVPVSATETEAAPMAVATGAILDVEAKRASEPSVDEPAAKRARTVESESTPVVPQEVVLAAAPEGAIVGQLDHEPEQGDEEEEADGMEAEQEADEAEEEDSFVQIEDGAGNEEFTAGDEELGHGAPLTAADAGELPVVAEGPAATAKDVTDQQEAPAAEEGQPEMDMAGRPEPDAGKGMLSPDRGAAADMGASGEDTAEGTGKKRKQIKWTQADASKVAERKHEPVPAPGERATERGRGRGQAPGRGLKRAPGKGA